MRAIAVLCVVLVHVTTINGFTDSVPDRLLLHMNIGVTIFFLISGFLLYRPFIAHRNGGPGAPAVGDYAKRRLLRILPAYWLVLTVVLLIPGIAANTDGRWLAQYALVFTLSDSGGWACGGCGLSQTWSLVVEASFYAALPLYVLAADRLARGRSTRGWLRLELGLLGALALASIVLHFFLYDGFPPAIVGGSLLSFGLWFCLGMGLAAISVALDGREPGSLRAAGARVATTGLWATAIVLYVVLSLALPATPFLTDAGQQLAAFAGFGIVALLLMIPPALLGSERGLPHAVLSWRPLSWLGLVSYGVFLWHIVVIRGLIEIDVTWSRPALLIATLAITTAIAAASYYAVERPLLRLKYRRPRQPRGAGTGTGGAAAPAGAGPG